MEEFFNTVGEVRSLIVQVSTAAEEVKKLHIIILSSPEQLPGNKQKLEQLNCDIRSSAGAVRSKLTALQEDSALDQNRIRSSVTQRIHRNQLSHLTRCFAEVMRIHHGAQVFFRERSRALIQRQLLIVDRAATDQELDRILQGHGQGVFISGGGGACGVGGAWGGGGGPVVEVDPGLDLNLGSASAQISAGTRTRALMEIRSRHQDLVSLESSITELQEIFRDTALLLDSQGEVMNSIEQNVRRAEDLVQVSSAETGKAVTFKKNPYKVSGLPGVFRSFRTKRPARPDQTTSDPHQD